MLCVYTMTNKSFFYYLVFKLTFPGFSWHYLLTPKSISTMLRSNLWNNQIHIHISSDTIRVAYKFGIIAMAAGIIGVPLGSGLVQYLRPRHSSRCDALVCAGGLIVSAPFVYASLVVAKYSVHWCFVCMFVAEVALNLCWSIVADILLVRGPETGDRTACAGQCGSVGVVVCKSIPGIRFLCHTTLFVF